MTPERLVLTLACGSLVGLDLASVPQAMFSRPLVAGLLGGAAAGRPLAGLGMGALLELFALDTLPVGATRNPDWGPAAVAMGAMAGGRDFSPVGVLALVLVAVLTSWIGGWSADVVRRANTRQVAARHAALESGDARVLAALQWGGLLRDALRGLVLTALALVLSALALLLAGQRGSHAALALVAVAVASVGVALHAGWRLAGRSHAWWFAGGLVLGVLASARWLR